MAEVQPVELKGEASFLMGDVIRQTADNYPDPRFRPRIIKETKHYTLAAIDPKPYFFWPTADGIGTKPELAERLFTVDGDPKNFETLFFDAAAMVEEDEYRFGRFPVGIAEVIDMNSSDPEVVSALAQGAKRACDQMRIALLNGETAELGYRTSGYGDVRVNWNAVAISIVNPDKLMLGNDLEPGQPVIAFRETSIRSNGLTRGRAILELAYLLRQTPYKSKTEYVGDYLRQRGMKGSDEDIIHQLRPLMGHDVFEQILLPWHTINPELTRQLLAPSTLYGPIMYDAQGGVDGEKQVQMIAAAHVSGGGVPEKGKRMVEDQGLGLSIDAVFPEPEPVKGLLELNEEIKSAGIKGPIENDRAASGQWNRGIGFMVVVPDEREAKKLIEIARNHNVEAAVAGKVIDKPEIQFRGETWRHAE